MKKKRLVLVVDQYLLESIVCTFSPYFWAWMYCWDMSYVPPLESFLLDGTDGKRILYGLDTVNLRAY